MPPWVMAAQEGGEFNSFPDLPPATAASDLPTSRTAAARGRRRPGGTLKPLGVNGRARPGGRRGPGRRTRRSGPRAFSDEPGRGGGATRARVVERLPAARRCSRPSSTSPGWARPPSPPRRARRTWACRWRSCAAATWCPSAPPSTPACPGVRGRPRPLRRRRLRDPGVALAQGDHRPAARELGFQGVAITDDLADPPITALEHGARRRGHAR